MRIVTIENESMGVKVEGRYERGAIYWFLRQWRVTTVYKGNTIIGEWYSVTSEDSDMGPLKLILNNL